jgi:hypothetical protein
VTAAGVGNEGPVNSDALVSVCRVRDGLVIAADRIGGTRLEVDAARLAAIDPFPATAGEAWR